VGRRRGVQRSEAVAGSGHCGGLGAMAGTDAGCQKEKKKSRIGNDEAVKKKERTECLTSGFNLAMAKIMSLIAR
jgi:hypothetical protein